MAVNVVLHERTQHCLRYRLEDDGQETVSPVTGTIDHATLLADAVPNSPLHKLLQTPVASAAEARTLLNGEGLIDDDDLVTPRGRLSMDHLTSVFSGSFGANANANESDEVFIEWETPNAEAQAVLCIRYVHSVDS